jgi:hypothetical protein
MASLAGQSWNVRARPLLLASRESASIEQAGSSRLRLRRGLDEHDRLTVAPAMPAMVSSDFSW